MTEELRAHTRSLLWQAWMESTEEIGSAAADVLFGRGMVVPEGGAAELERLRARVMDLEDVERWLLSLLPTAPCPVMGLPNDLATAQGEYGAWQQVAEVLGVQLPYAPSADEDPVTYELTPAAEVAVGGAVERSVDKLRALLAPSGVEESGKVTRGDAGGITRADAAQAVRDTDVDAINCGCPAHTKCPRGHCCHDACIDCGRCCGCPCTAEGGGSQ